MYRCSNCGTHSPVDEMLFARDGSARCPDCASSEVYWLDATVEEPRFRVVLFNGERILAPGIWVQTDTSHPHQPTPSGFVLCGYTHASCIKPASLIANVFGVPRDRRQHGFLTTEDRFITDRKQAMRVAVMSGQVPYAMAHLGLDSSDLLMGRKP